MAINYDQLNRLSDEARNLLQATANLEAGGKIVGMTIGSPPYDPTNPGAAIPGMPAMVNTSGMEYPQAMVDSIKTSINARYQTVSNEIHQLMTAPDRAQATAARRPRPQ